MNADAADDGIFTRKTSSVNWGDAEDSCSDYAPSPALQSMKPTVEPEPIAPLDEAPQKEPQQHKPEIPFPSSPPYAVIVKNLPYSAYENDIADFFRGCDIEDIRIVKDQDGRPRGFAYVDFVNQDSLREALRADNRKMSKRNVYVELTQSRQRSSRNRGDGKRDDRRSSSRNNRDSYDDDRRSRSRNNRDNRDSRDSRDSYDDDRRGGFNRRGNESNLARSKSDTASEPQRPMERKKLQILPRTTSNESNSQKAATPKFDPFGGARPREAVLSDRAQTPRDSDLIKSFDRDNRDNQGKGKNDDNKKGGGHSRKKSFGRGASRMSRKDSGDRDNESHDTSRGSGDNRRGGKQGGRGGRLNNERGAKKDEPQRKPVVKSAPPPQPEKTQIANKFDLLQLEEE